MRKQTKQHEEHEEGGQSKPKLRMGDLKKDSPAFFKTQKSSPVISRRRSKRAQAQSQQTAHHTFESPSSSPLARRAVGASSLHANRAQPPTDLVKTSTSLPANPSDEEPSAERSYGDGEENSEDDDQGDFSFIRDNDHFQHHDAGAQTHADHPTGSHDSLHTFKHSEQQTLEEQAQQMQTELMALSRGCAQEDMLAFGTDTAAVFRKFEALKQHQDVLTQQFWNLEDAIAANRMALLEEGNTVTPFSNFHAFTDAINDNKQGVFEALETLTSYLGDLTPLAAGETAGAPSMTQQHQPHRQPFYQFSSMASYSHDDEEAMGLGEDPHGRRLPRLPTLDEMQSRISQGMAPAQWGADTLGRAKPGHAVGYPTRKEHLVHHSKQQQQQQQRRRHHDHEERQQARHDRRNHHIKHQQRQQQQQQQHKRGDRQGRMPATVTGDERAGMYSDEDEVVGRGRAHHGGTRYGQGPEKGYKHEAEYEVEAALEEEEERLRSQHRSRGREGHGHGGDRERFEKDDDAGVRHLRRRQRQRQREMVEVGPGGRYEGEVEYKPEALDEEPEALAAHAYELNEPRRRPGGGGGGSGGKGQQRQRQRSERGDEEYGGEALVHGVERPPRGRELRDKRGDAGGGGGGGSLRVWDEGRRHIQALSPSSSLEHPVFPDSEEEMVEAEERGVGAPLSSAHAQRTRLSPHGSRLYSNVTTEGDTGSAGRASLEDSLRFSSGLSPRFGTRPESGARVDSRASRDADIPPAGAPVRVRGRRAMDVDEAEAMPWRHGDARRDMGPIGEYLYQDDGGELEDMRDGSNSLPAVRQLREDLDAPIRGHFGALPRRSHRRDGRGDGGGGRGPDVYYNGYGHQEEEMGHPGYGAGGDEWGESYARRGRGVPAFGPDLAASDDGDVNDQDDHAVVPRRKHPRGGSIGRGVARDGKSVHDQARLEDGEDEDEDEPHELEKLIEG